MSTTSGDRTAAAVASVLVLSLAVPALAEFPPKTTENLKVLPAETDVREVIGVMRTFATGLGVRCEHCHVGEAGQPLDTFDFASDDKEAKRTARVMMRMVHAINDQHLADLPGEAGERREVQCVTCHHGLERPDTLEAALSRAHAEGGAEAAVTEYRRLRDEHYGSAAYDFSEWRLLGVADRLARGGDVEAAEALIDLNLEQFPGSTDTRMFQARFYAFQGQSERAVQILRAVLADDPENEHARRMLDRFEQSPEPR